MPKQKYIAARDLKDCLPNVPLKTGKAEKKIKAFLKFFYRDTFVLP
jgi:hypothetical protein